MKGFEEVVRNVWLLKLPFSDGSYYTGATLVRAGEQWALIDSGETEAVARELLLPALREQGADRSLLLLCTHTHGDHIGGHAFLRSELGCPAACTAEAANTLPGGQPERLLEDGSYPLAGLRMLKTPGHAPEAVSFLHEESGTLITGDGFQACGTDGVGLALIDRAKDYRASLNRVRALSPERLVCGHGFAPCDFVVEGRLRVRAFFQCCEDTLARYEDFLRAWQGARDASVIGEALVEAEGRTLPWYIVRGDNSVKTMAEDLLGWKL